MSPKYMLDTNMVIYLMKHRPPQVAARFAQCLVGEVVISAITLAELEYGVACSGDAQPQNRAALDSLLHDIVPVPFDRDAAAAYGPIRLSTSDRRTDALDKLVASHAVALGATLVTNNEADFAGHPGLCLENWVAV